MESQTELLKWFDLEISNGKINKEILDKVTDIFCYWKHIRVITVGNQKLSKWRPLHSIALISSAKDLMDLHKIVEKEIQNKNKKFDILFENQTVARFFIE